MIILRIILSLFVAGFAWFNGLITLADSKLSNWELKGSLEARRLKNISFMATIILIVIYCVV